MAYHYDKNTLFVNGRAVVFTHEIRMAEICDDLIIVLLAIPYGDDTIDNLYAVDQYGDVVWQSQKLKLLYPTQSIDPYEGFRLTEDGIIAYDFCARRYLISPETGKVLKQTVGRW